MADARLVTLEGRGKGLTFSLGLANTLGRDPENTIQVLDEKISRHHAVLRHSEGAWTLQDLGSRNGTFLDNQRIEGAIQLSGGEVFRIGDTIMRFELGRSQPPNSVSIPSGPPGAQGDRPQSGISIRNLPHRSVEIQSAEINPVVRAAADVSGRSFFALEEGADLAEVTRRLQASFQINKALSNLMDVEDLGESILKELFSVVPATRGVVLIKKSEDEELVPVALRDRDNSKATSRKIPISSTLLSHVLSQREAVLMTDVLADTDLGGAASIVAQGIQSAISAPFIYQDELVGLLHLENRDTAKAFSKDDLELVASVASQAAVAVANSKLLAKVKEESEHRANLSRYLAPELVEQLLDGKINLEMKGATCQVTVLFSDLRGFTAMSEKMTSREVFRTLNEYFQRMVDVILEFGGSIDKFMGDAIMAVWGIPTPQENDTTQAVAAAIKMQQVLKSFNLEREQAGRPPIHMGVGINSGPALAGNLGARQRMEYTVIGDNVNLASRLEGLTSAGQILISETTMALVRQSVDAEELPPVKVKGKQHPVKVFEVKALHTSSSDEGVNRSHDRMKTAVKVSLVDPSGKAHQGILSDISAGGAGIKFLPEEIQGLSEGEEVLLPFGGGAESSLGAVRGKLVRIIHGKDKAGRILFKVGIQFLDPPEKVKELARSLVNL